VPAWVMGDEWRLLIRYAVVAFVDGEAAAAS
jgi:hypothetical protein